MSAALAFSLEGFIAFALPGERIAVASPFGGVSSRTRWCSHCPHKMLLVWLVECGLGMRKWWGTGTRIAGAGVVVGATLPFTCTLVCVFVWVGVLDTPTIPFSGAKTFSGWLGGSVLSLGQLGSRACCWSQGSCCVVGCCCCCCVVVIVVVIVC